jgi:5-methylcytosine-specific restriction enzyme subunit McrC
VPTRTDGATVTEGIELREYQSAVVRMPATAARDVAEVSGGKVTVGVGPEPGTWAVTASGWVGTVVTPGFELLVRPKVPLHSLFLMLDVGLPPDAWQPATFAFGTDRNLLAAMAAFYARTAEQAVGRGLRRDYRQEEGRLVTLRGRVDLAAQLRTPGAVSPVACRFDEYTADILENRALKAAARRLLRLPGVRPATRRLLERLVVQLDEVADVAVEPSAVDRIVFNRLNRHYEPALRLAALVLRNTSLLDRVGAADASAFLLDMPTLFQRWLTDRLARHLRRRLSIVSEPLVHLGDHRRVPMLPDFVFHDPEGRVVYGGDAKYKLTSDGRGRNADYYQLFAYLTALRLREGVLIYCQADDAPDREVVVSHVGTRLWTYPLSLAGPVDEVEGAVSDLAGWLVEHADAPDRVLLPGCP